LAVAKDNSKDIMRQIEAKGFRKLTACRVGGGDNLVSVLSLGNQELTGVFPRDRHEAVTAGPLELVWCPNSGLLQLGHSYDPVEMYGHNYGYRSGLNRSMADHLGRKIRYLQKCAQLRPGDAVLDIGSNDATSLKAYTVPGIRRVGIDPTGAKFRKYYSDDMILVPDFFSAGSYRGVMRQPARIVTAIAMFYDLEDPIGFARSVHEILADDGVWHFEQSYMPSMLRLCSYDAICHEHLEFYSLSVIQSIMAAADLKVVDVQMNAVNGGSIAVTAVKRSNPAEPNAAVIDWLLGQEERMGLFTPKPYRDFEERVHRHRNDLRRLLQALVADGKKVLGYGASTKGNVMLQFCGITPAEVLAIGEVNPDKFGAFTPGTHIPIISEEEARAMSPDYFLVLPWHFKDSILQREQAFLDRGGKMIFPLPEIEIV
jgi:hypothetical protein